MSPDFESQLRRTILVPASICFSFSGNGFWRLRGWGGGGAVAARRRPVWFFQPRAARKVRSASSKQRGRNHDPARPVKHTRAGSRLLHPRRPPVHRRARENDGTACSSTTLFACRACRWERHLTFTTCRTIIPTYATYVPKYVSTTAWHRCV